MMVFALLTDLMCDFVNFLTTAAISLSTSAKLLSFLAL